ncbi:hypothetical protein L2750_08915 [Shewanella submarina]|uniref:DUF3426 domain-containing protein n=1 Tax=Shewanella submarina TaxID=2016376 RepID=A0ABV7GBD4_9GAMM|nr:hypothetical protein [Shewanella submarina]MCL1037274.1 hypothetical protein [Shewanella submarina]
MKNQLLLAVVIAMVSVPAIATIYHAKMNNFYVRSASPELLYGVKVVGKSIQVAVVSTGCTGVESFKVKVIDESEQQTTLQLLRVKPDLCRAIPHLIEIEIPLPKEAIAREILMSNSIGDASRYRSNIKVLPKPD